MNRGLCIASVALLGVLASACGENASIRSGIDHPTGADAVVLRVEEGGGFVPREFVFTALPSFSLIGDGTAITQGPQIEIYPGPALPNLLATPVTEDGVQRILEEAREAGLFGPDRHYDHPGIADASTTTFTLAAEGKTHRISAYALAEGEDTGPMVPAEEREARAKLAAFRAKLGGLREWLPEGSVGEEGFHSFEALRTYVQPYTASPETPEEPQRQRQEWPLDGDLAAFGASHDQGTRCGVVDGADLDRLLPKVREANQLTLWRSEGKEYAAWFRPLLPDESGCPPSPA